jgi:electron transfer flavoprotein alpha subunit
VLCIDAPELENYLTEPYAQAVYKVITTYKPSIFLIGATTIGRDLGPRLSARLETGLTADCTKLDISEDKQLLMTRPAFGGNLMATIMCTQRRPQMSTVRPGVMKKMIKDETRKGEFEFIDIQFDKKKIERVCLVETHKIDKGLKDISEARILVSGGRGIGNKGNFEKLQSLAAVLTSRGFLFSCLVDAGVMTHDRQVGQTVNRTSRCLFCTGYIRCHSASCRHGRI